MYWEKEENNFVWILSNKRFFEFDYLQKLAKNENTTNVLCNEKLDEYFGCVLINQHPAFSAICTNKGLYPANVLRATKFYVNKKYRNNSFSILKKVYIGMLNYFSNIEGYNFYFTSRHPNDTPFTKIYKSIGWNITNEKLYLVSENKNLPLSWKHIYYKGDIETFTVPSMTIDEYKIKFEKKI